MTDINDEFRMTNGVLDDAEMIRALVAGWLLRLVPVSLTSSFAKAMVDKPADKQLPPFTMVSHAFTRIHMVSHPFEKNYEVMDYEHAGCWHMATGTLWVD